ncbi:MAG: pirin-like C-terminal cupin domain-containing protein, partial [Janthinobacterium sp.]
LAGQPHRTHGLQLWAALPKAHEEDEPSFTHTPQADIPVVPLDGAVVKVLIGTAFGRTSPVRTYMRTVYLDVALQAGRTLRLEGLPPEAAIYPISGDVLVDGVALAPHTMALIEAGAVPVVTAGGAPVQFVVIGGEPLDGHRFLFWNFVSSSKERLSQAADDWTAQRMGSVPGETEFIPLPKAPLRPPA